jgi:hypothetical protein
MDADHVCSALERKKCNDILKTLTGPQVAVKLEQNASGTEVPGFANRIKTALAHYLNGQTQDESSSFAVIQHLVRKSF